MNESFEWTVKRRSLWVRLERALDERRDPLQDSNLRAELAADPELLHAAETLVRRLGCIAQPIASPEPADPNSELNEQPSGLRAWPRLLRVAALAGTAALVVLAVRQRSSGPPSTEPVLATAAPTVSLVIEKLHPSAPLGRTVRLSEQPVLHWTLESHTQ